MLRRYLNYLCILIVLLTVGVTGAYAESTPGILDSYAAASLDASPNYKAISKVKPSEPAVTKVRPGIMSRFEGLSRFNPANWGGECILPAPAKGQFTTGPWVWFGTIKGEARRGVGGPNATPGSKVDFHDNLGFGQNATTIWGFDAKYQLRPRFGLRYSFMPMKMESKYTTPASFTFANQLFASGTLIESKWERYQHRAGVTFNLSNNPSSRTSIFAEWMYLQDKLHISSAVGGATTPVVWDDTRNVAVVGAEFDKCLKNFHGNSLNLSCKADVLFLNDCFGFDAETALNYMIPIKTGRFGFIKGGYRYSYFQKDNTRDLFDTSIGGVFIQVGFLF
ncbi:MAG: hypothetical protein M1511_06740 [Deltaproteobacteria bacterium]|nr:hypothetical protein [Deltaproteobacteria bacterium]